uniref:Phosphoglycerate mutase n=1 Tax=Faecalibaculum rodentium TaxID=1702221 RepID=A0A140DW86_9FIRM|nr:phosphoglycerate mutase [Faecalibaculum rodentium]
MKKSLVLMRHGETVFNKRKRIQGWVDLSLTALGKEPAK